MTKNKRHLLMVHGLSGSARIWDAMVPQFEDTYTCVPVTLLENLRTKKAPPIELTDLGLRDYIEHLSTLTKRLTAENNGLRPIIIGHSFGGLLAQKLAERGLVSAAIFLAPAQPADCRVNKLSVYMALWSIVRIPQNQWIGRSYRLHGRSFRWGALHNVPEFKRRAITDELRYDSGKMIHELANTPPHIDETRIFVPTLTIGAGKDRVIPLQGVRRMAEKYRWAGCRGDFLEYPNNSHWIIDEDGTDVVVKDVKAWLAKRLG